MTPEQKSELRIDLVKIVVDKFLVASIVVAVGFFANRALETFKAEQEMNRLRIQKVAAVWETVYAFEDAFADARRHVDELLTGAKPSKTRLEQCSETPHGSASGRAITPLAKILECVEPQMNDVANARRKNRFWIDHKADTAIADYLRAVVIYQSIMSVLEKDAEGSNDPAIRRKIDDANKSLLETVKKMADESRRDFASAGHDLARE